MGTGDSHLKTDKKLPARKNIKAGIAGPYFEGNEASKES